MLRRTDRPSVPLALLCGLFALAGCGSQPEASPPVRSPVAETAAAVPVASAPVQPAAETLVALDRPFQYAFLAWEGKAKIDGGRAILPGIGTKGGAGITVPMDLSARADRSPALRLRTGPGNTAKAVHLRLLNGSGVLGTWSFALPAPAADTVLIVPADGASFAAPNRVANNQDGSDATGFDPAKVTGWQLAGDWQEGILDVTIEAILSVPPDAAMLAQRTASAATGAAEKTAAAREATDATARLAAERKDLARRYGTRNPGSPEVTAASTVAPDLISLEIEAQRVVPVVFGRYEAQPGDEKRPEKAHADREVGMARLFRDGKSAGWLQGPAGKEWLTTPEGIAGDPLLDFLAEDAANYAVTSSDDPAYATARRPTAVFRKSKPTDWQQQENRFPARHRLYLRMEPALAAGKSYRIAIANLNVVNPEVALAYDSRVLRSEAVHVNQIGFRPDDPAKRAFLSLWLGSGGGHAYPAGLRFSVIDEATGADAFSGPVELALAADGTESLGGQQVPNGSRTPVYRMDFAGLTAPGRYRVHVDGVGCSYPFEIGVDVWKKAFLVQMRGLFNNRSGIELGAPYTAFNKPRDFHPDDGAVITRSTCDVFAAGDLSYSAIAKGDTGERVADAWGGYHDAGDWNPRRVSHMQTTMAQLELVELFPAYFTALSLNIPKEPGIPDIITEALFEVDCFHRLQLPDGGMPFGLESDGDPLPFEISWLSSQRVHVTAPNIRDSWYYAAVAARTAKVLAPFKPERAAIYRTSAERAFAWAEADYAKRKTDGTLAQYKELWTATDNRNLAALVLFDLTGEARYHGIFLEDTRLTSKDLEICWWGKAIQCDAAFLYARLDDAKADPALKRNAVTAVRKQAQKSLDFAAGNAFSVTNKDKFRPVFCGFFSTPGGTEIARAHYLTGSEEYLSGTIRSTLFGAGCNPNNLVYTTGLGTNPVRHPLHVDARNTGQTPPEGLTVFGNLDYWKWKGGFWDWPVKFINKPATCWPDAYDWPLTEAFFDVHLFVSQNEFVIDTWAPNVFVWGYLAARGQVQ